MIVLTFVMIFIASGCLQEQELQTTETVCQGQTLDASCVVTFYKSQNASYITKQNHQICMTDVNIEITADEPQGKVKYRLDSSNFLGQSNNAGTICNKTYAKLILTTMRLGDYGWQSIAGSPENAKIFGKNYKKLTISASGAFSEHYVPWAEITLFANPNKKIIERVSIKNLKNGTELASYAYNWRLVKELGKRMPTKIDVLNTDKGTINATGVLQVHYLDLIVK